MASFNRVILVGNLTRDPELSYTPSNTAVCKFGLAINRKWKDKEEVCFVDCVVWSKPAETFNQYMSKGRPVLVEGRLKLNRWTNQQGEKQSKLEVIVENFTFLGGGRDGGGGGGRAPADAAAGEPVADNDGPPPTDDDIPF